MLIKIVLTSRDQKIKKTKVNKKLIENFNLNICIHFNNVQQKYIY